MYEVGQIYKFHSNPYNNKEREDYRGKIISIEEDSLEIYWYSFTTNKRVTQNTWYKIQFERELILETDIVKKITIFKSRLDLIES